MSVFTSSSLFAIFFFFELTEMGLYIILGSHVRVKSPTRLKQADFFSSVIKGVRAPVSP